jgi:hypothetical protein
MKQDGALSCLRMPIQINVQRLYQPMAWKLSVSGSNPEGPSYFIILKEQVMKSTTELKAELEEAHDKYAELAAYAEEAIGTANEARYWQRADQHWEQVVMSLKTDLESAINTEELEKWIIRHQLWMDELESHF